MRKTFYYNIIPSKVEEDACRARKVPWRVTRVLVETRDLTNSSSSSSPFLDLRNPFYIRKGLSHYETITGKLVLPFADTFDNVLRFWNLGMANHVVTGHKVSVVLWDVTDHSTPRRYHGGANNVVFEMSLTDDFSLSCFDLFRDRNLRVADEIGLFWDPRTSSFHFKLLRRAA